MIFVVKKSVAKDLFKSLGKSKLEELKREVIEILKKQDEKEYKKAIEQFTEEEEKITCLEKSISGEWVEKAGYGIGTVRVWKGKKYKKIAPGKWARMYEKEDRGVNIAVGKLIAKVKKIDDIEELMNFVMQNKQRFQDENGKDLPILDKIRAEVDEQNKKISSGKVGSKGKTVEDKVKENPDYPFKPMTDKERAERAAFEKDRDDFIERMDKIRQENKKKDSKPAEKVGEGKILDYKNNPSFDKYKNMSDSKLDTAVKNLSKRVEDMKQQLNDNSDNENISLGIASVKAQNNLLATLKQIQKDKGNDKPAEKKEEKHTDNAKFVKEVKGDVWEEWNTDPNKFAMIYDKNTGKAKGLRMTQDIVDIINSVVEPSVLDWQDNVAKKVHEKYPEIKESYIKENIKQIRMGYRNGSQEKIQILNKESEPIKKEEVSFDEVSTSLDEMVNKNEKSSKIIGGVKVSYDPQNGYRITHKAPTGKEITTGYDTIEEAHQAVMYRLNRIKNGEIQKIEKTEKEEENKTAEKTEESSDSLREKYKEKDKEYSEILQKLIYARDHNQDTSKYDEKVTKIHKELSDIENKIKNAEEREVKRSGKPSDFTLDDINSQKTVKTIEDFEDVIKEIDKIKDDYEAADKFMDFLASNMEGGFGGKLHRAIMRKYKSENLRGLAREVKGKKPLDTRDVSYADEYANKEEESKKKENSKNMTPKQQKTFDDFEKKAIKYAGSTDREKRFAKHNYNIDGEDWTITTDGRVMLCSREKFEEPTKTDKITNMDKVFVINGQKESAIPDGIDAIIKAAPKKVVVGKDYNGKEKKEFSVIKLGDRYFNTDYLKTVQNFLGPLSNAKMQVIPGDNKGRVKFESGNKAVVLLPIDSAELKNRIINTNDIKKSLEDIIMFCNDFEDEDEVIEEINNESLFSDYSAENSSEFNSIKYKVADAFKECGY